MPPKISITDILSDPDFHNLPLQDRVQVLSRVSGLSNLSPSAESTPMPSGMGNNLDLDIRGPRGAYQSAAMGVGRAFGGASEPKSFLQSLNPISSEPGLTGGVETATNIASLLPATKILKGAGMVTAAEKLPIAERIMQLLNSPLENTISKTITTSGAKQLTKKGSEDFARDATQYITKAPGMRQIAEQGTGASNSLWDLGETGTRNISETTSSPIIQALAQKYPMATLALKAASALGPGGLMSIMRAISANALRAGGQTVASPSPDQSSY